MKTCIYFTFVLLILSSSITFGQSNIQIGVNGGIGIPTGDVSDSHKTGFNLGGTVLIPTSHPIIGFIAGASYLNLSGKTVTESFGGSTFTIEFESSNLISIFAGPKIGKDKGVYFLPTISGNFDEGESRFGVDLGGGILVPLGTGKTKFDISAKLSLTNLVGKEEGESSANIIRILAGVVFDLK